jgi:hypothetical protein
MGGVHTCLRIQLRHWMNVSALLRVLVAFFIANNTATHEEVGGRDPEPLRRVMGRENLLHLPHFEPRTIHLVA